MSLSDTMFGMHVLGNYWNPNATAHQGVSYSDLITLAEQGGSSVIRIPLDLSAVSAIGPASYILQDILGDLQQAYQHGLTIIFEPGQTPEDIVQNHPDFWSDEYVSLNNSGLDPASADYITPEEQHTHNVNLEPDTNAGLIELAQRYALLVEAVYETFPQYASVIAGWEVGNEPNLSYQYTGTYWSGDDPTVSDQTPRNFAVSVDNAEWYATYLDAVADAVHTYDPSINVIGAGIAHNDVAYMQEFFATLQALNADVDGFSVHPYTTYPSNPGPWAGGSPASGRPTDWVGDPVSDPWGYYYSFQGALYNYQALINQYGFGGADLWVTEFGVPSYQGWRGAGEQGEIDQTYWYAEALGVFDSWGNSTLQGIIAHDVLDNYYAEQNDWYNAYDSNPNNNGDQGLAEGSFGLFEHSSTTGLITPKLAVGLIKAIVGGYDYSNPAVRILSIVSTNTVDISQWGTSGAGLLDGYVVLTHGGDDSISGSAYGDSLFAGNGNDLVDGNGGADRIYGGAGDDFLYGEDGDDDLYGNTGDDTISGGAGSNRIDGGTGWDVLLLEGTSADFTITGDGAYLLVTTAGGWLATVAFNVEQIVFVADGTTYSLTNADPNRGNGGVSGGATGNVAPQAANDAGIAVTAGGTTTVNVLANDSDANGDPLTITHINGVAFTTEGWTSYISGVGLVQRNSDNTLTIHTLDTSPGAFSFTYTVSDAVASATATVSGTILSGGSTITGTSGVDYLDGTIGNDTILAGDSNDQLYGDRGNDILNGQGGTYNQVNYDGYAADYTFVQNADGSITVTNATYGTDTLLNIDGFWFFGEEAWYAASALVVPAGGGSTITGTSGVDYLDGNIGNDTILAGDGNDQLYGDRGNDILDGQGGTYNQVNYDGYSADYTFIQNADGSITVTNATYGTDTLLNIDGFWFFGEEAWYAASALVVPAGSSSTITGTSGVDYLDGTIGNDTILAGDGNDQLYGDRGNDILDGQGGTYNQVNYDGYAADYTFVQNADGSITVTNEIYGIDMLHNIDGIWFNQQEQWYSVDVLVV